MNSEYLLTLAHLVVFDIGSLRKLSSPGLRPKLETPKALGELSLDLTGSGSPEDGRCAQQPNPLVRNPPRQAVIPTEEQ